VVGAGPAGSCAATYLARGNRRVALIDKASFPRDKFCGDGLTTGALRELEALGLAPNSVASWMPVNDVVVRSPSGHEVTYPLPRGEGLFAVVARRCDLDHALVGLARAAGADVFEGAALVSASIADGRAMVEAKGVGRLEAPVVIGADGMWSPLRKQLGAATPHYLGEWHAFRQYFGNVAGRAERELMVWFEPELLPGYAWSFPLPGGAANVGFGVLRDGKRSGHDAKALWPRLLALPHVRDALGPKAEPTSPYRAWPIPARITKTCLTVPHALFVGDAAAATDAMTGEGIGQALLTGRLAAQAVIEGGDVCATYAKSVKRALFADHRASVALARVLSRERLASAAVRISGINDWTRRNFSRWLFEDYPRALLATPRRWHRGMFTGPGAYQ